MVKKDDRNGLHVCLVEATVLERSDFPGAFRRGVPITLDLHEASGNVNVTRGDGRVIIARLNEGQDTARLIEYLRAGNVLTGKVEDIAIQPFATVLLIRLDRVTD